MLCQLDAYICNLFTWDNCVGLYLKKGYFRPAMMLHNILITYRPNRLNKPMTRAHHGNLRIWNNSKIISMPTVR